MVKQDRVRRRNPLPLDPIWERPGGIDTTKHWPMMSTIHFTDVNHIWTLLDQEANGELQILSVDTTLTGYKVAIMREGEARDSATIIIPETGDKNE